MVRSRIAAVVAAGTLAIGGGIALAETAPDDPSLDTTEETEELVETEGAETEGDETEGAETEGEETEELVETEEVDTLDGEGPPEGSHGALVSEAAKDHSHDEACGNHGRWVSHWARHGEAPDCATEVSTDEELATESDESEDTTEESSETEETSEDTTDASAASTTDDGGPGKGKGRGKNR